MAVQPLRQAHRGTSPPADAGVEYEYDDTRELVALVNDAVALVQAKGEAAFGDFSVENSRWRHDDTYVFVLDPDGNMLVHTDPALKGGNSLDLKDVGGRAVIRGLIAAATESPGRPGGWYHYQWPVPGGILPRWKSSYVRLASAPSGQRFIVGSGMYNERMERVFVPDAVTRAVALIERDGEAAYSLLRDPAGPFTAKSAYVFVLGKDGVQLVNPAFPYLEGRRLLDEKDARGRPFVREMLDLVRERSAGWVDYMWPKPGESAATQKSAYVTTANVGDTWVVVGAGVYLPDAPKDRPGSGQPTPAGLMGLVREAAAVLEQRGEEAYPEFRRMPSRWFHDDTYFFAWEMDGTVVFHAADQARAGGNDRGLTDVLGRPVGRMILDVASTDSGEGWIHYMYPRAGGILPAWKSTFLKRVTMPSGRQLVIGCGIYDMQMDQTLIEDVVHRAARLVARKGRDAFDQLRDAAGPFVFMDTYVFVLSPDGTELVNPAFPRLEGVNVMRLTDLDGKAVAKEEIAVADSQGRGWVECRWYKPGQNTPARKLAYVEKAESGGETLIVGSGLYVE